MHLKGATSLRTCVLTPASEGAADSHPMQVSHTTSFSGWTDTCTHPYSSAHSIYYFLSYQPGQPSHLCPSLISSVLMYANGSFLPGENCLLSKP
jgi:hypothetical protein